MIQSGLQGCRSGRLHWSWRVHVWQMLHRFAGVVDVEGQWISVLRTGFYLLKGLLCSEVVDRRSVEETSALEWQPGARITGPRVRRTISENTTCGGLQTPDADGMRTGRIMAIDLSVDHFGKNTTACRRVASGP